MRYNIEALMYRRIVQITVLLVIAYTVALCSYFFVLSNAAGELSESTAGKHSIMIKDTNVLTGLMLKTYDSKLVDIVRYISTRYPICITESYRKAMHTGDLHSTNPVRAVDLRSWIYTDDELKSLIQEVNTMWEYDSTRPHLKCIICHDSGGGKHLHLQVHPRTKCLIPEVCIRDKI